MFKYDSKNEKKRRKKRILSIKKYCSTRKEKNKKNQYF